MVCTEKLDWTSVAGVNKLLTCSNFNTIGLRQAQSTQNFWCDSFYDLQHYNASVYFEFLIMSQNFFFEKRQIDFLRKETSNWFFEKKKRQIDLLQQSFRQEQGGGLIILGWARE